MKFGVTDIEQRLTPTVPASPSRQRSSQHSGNSATRWEERIAQPKKLRAARRADEKVDTCAGKAEAAYRRWLEERTARIEALRAHIETGTYHVDSATISADMLRRVEDNGR